MIGLGIGVRLGKKLQSSVSQILANDSFDRPDNLTTLGNTDNGLVWQPQSSSVYGIQSSKAYCVSDGNGHASCITLPAADYKLTATIGGTLNSTTNFRSPGFIIRQSGSDLIIVRPRASMIEIIKVIGSVVTTIATPAVSTPDNTMLPITIECKGANLKVTFNGTSFSYTFVGNELNLLTATGMGLRLAKGGTPAYQAYWDNLIVEAV